MKSYQELIEERKKELMRGAETSTTSAPKALSVAEAIEKRKQELAKDVTTSVPTAAASAPSGVLDPVERARRLAEGIPLDPVLPDNPNADAVLPPDRMQNIVPQGLSGYILQPAVQLGGMAVDALRAPHEAWIAATYGQKYRPQVAGRLEAAALNESIRGQTDEMFPKPRATVELERDLKDDNGFVDSVESYVRNPVGTLQKGAEALVGAAPVTKALGVLGGSAAMGGGSSAVGAASEFDDEASKGIVQQSPEYKSLSEEYGPEEALRILKAQRISDTAVIAGAAAAATAGLTSKYGLNPLESRLAGMSPTTSAASMPLREAFGEVPEEVATQLGANVAASWTGSNKPLTEGLPQSAAGGLVLGAAASAPIAGIDFAREKLQAAGAFADGSKKATDSTDTRSSFVPDPAINEALAAGQEEGGATTPPAPTQKAPVAPPVKPQGQVSREASVAAGQRILVDLKTDPTLGVPEADRPRVLHERTKVYEAQEQAKLDGPKEVSKTLKLVRDIGKTVRTEPNILAGVEAPTNRILTNVTKGIAPLSATELAVRKLASEGRAPIIQQTGQPLQNTVPVPAPTTTKAQDQKAALGIVRRIGKEANATPALPVGLEASTNQIVSGITKGIEPLSSTEQFVRKMVRDAPAPRAPAPPAPFNPATARFPEQPSSVEPTASMPQRIRVGGRFAPKGVVGTASTQPRGNITQGVPIVQSATLGEASTTIGATKALEAVEPIRVTQPEQQSQQGEMTDGMQGQEEGRRDSSNQEVTDNAPVGTGQATGSMRGATNARAAMLRVGGSLEPGVNSELRRTANELKNSPNTQDTKVVVMTAEEAIAEGSPLRKVDADGTVTAGKAAYGRNGDTIYLQEDATTEDVVHETVHAATVKAIAAVEQGVVADPESTLALENLKAAVNRLGEITAADLPGVPAEIVARIQYAARNPQEAVAVLRSSPETARALRDSKIMVDVKADRKTKIPVKMPILKAIINSIASIVGKQMFKTQHRDQVVRTIERMLLADSVIQSSKTLERTDVRGIKMSDVKAGDTASRLTGTDAKRGVAPIKTDNMFVGEQAKTRPPMSAEDKESWEDNWTSEEIRRYTGWFRNPWDGKWRREVDDSKAELYPEFATMEESKTFGARNAVKLSDILKHDALYAEYPELADVEVVKRSAFMDFWQAVQGSYDQDTNTMTVTPYAKDPLSTLLHEIQHWVQNKEGFATGGNQQSAIRNLPQDRKEQLATQIVDDLQEQYSTQVDLANSMRKALGSREVIQLMAQYVLARQEWLDSKVGQPSLDANARQDEARRQAYAALNRAGVKDTTGVFTQYYQASAALQKGERNLYSVFEKSMESAAADAEKEATKLRQRISALTSGDEKTLNKELAQHETAYQFYLNLAGEIEARAVQERQKSDAEERVINPPYNDTLANDSISMEDVIVTYDGGKSESRTGPGASQETPLSKGKGLESAIARVVPDFAKRALLARQTGSQEIFDMVESMRGAGNYVNHTLVSDLASLKEVGHKELGKRLWQAEGTQNKLVQYFSGDPSISLPASIKKAVDKIRATVDGLSFQLAALGVLSADKVAALAANVGKWTHRSYKAWDMRQGDWADLVRSSRGKDAPTVAEDIFATVKDQMISDITIPDDGVLDALYNKATDKNDKEGAANAISKLNTMLFNHVPAVFRADTDDAPTIKEQVEGLKKARDDYTNNPEKVVENAHRLMNTLLDPKATKLLDDNTSTAYKLFATDTSATKSRTKVPDWLQTIWGKNTELDAVAIATVHAISDMVAKHSKLVEFKQTLIDSGSVRTPEQGGVFGYTLLSSNNGKMDYGPLEKHYIKNEDRAVVEVLGAKGAAETAAIYFGGETANAAWRFLENANATSKIMNVTLNLDALVVNAISTIGAISGSLVTPIQATRNLTKSLSMARREALNVVPFMPILNKPTTQQEAEFAADLKQGFEAAYLGDAAISQDLRSELLQQVLDEAYKGAPKAKRAWEAAKRTGRDIKDVGSRLAAAGDTAGKMLSWYNRIPQLALAHPELSPEQVKALALEHAKSSMPSYTRSAPLARLIAKRGVFIGAFAVFNSAMYQTAYNDVKRGIEYLHKGATENNAAAAWYGTQQLMTAVVKGGVIGASWKVAGLAASAIGAAVAGAFGDDEESDEVKQEVAQYAEANRVFQTPEAQVGTKFIVPDHMRGDTFPIRKVDADNWTFSSMSRYDPMPFNNALVVKQKGGSPWEVTRALVEGMVGVSIIGEPLIKAASSMDDADRASGFMGDALRSVLVPGTARKLARTFDTEIRGLDEGGVRDLITAVFPLPKNETELTGWERSMGWMGATVSAVNIPQEVARKLSRLGTEVNKQQSKASEALDNSIQKDDTFWEQVTAIDQTALDSYQKARNIIDGAKAYGYDAAYIEDAADRYSVNIEKDMLYGALDGELYLPDVYETIDRWYDKNIKLAEGNVTKTQQVTDRYDRLYKEAEAREKARRNLVEAAGIKVAN